MVAARTPATTTKAGRAKPNPNSPWRKGPNCDTKRAQASYARYRKKEPKA